MLISSNRKAFHGNYVFLTGYSSSQQIYKASTSSIAIIEAFAEPSKNQMTSQFDGLSTSQRVRSPGTHRLGETWMAIPQERPQKAGPSAYRMTSPPQTIFCYATCCRQQHVVNEDIYTQYAHISICIFMINAPWG